MPRKKKTSIESDIEQKLQYIGLALDKIPKKILEYEELDYRIPKGFDEREYKQYRYIPINKIQILLSPTNRLDEIEEKYAKARPLSDYLDNKNEENLLRHTVFLNMLRQVNIKEIEELEKEQAKLEKKIPFMIKYPGNYLWQIYYSESTDKYFMIVPTQDSNYSAFFYLLRQKLKKNNNSNIFVPVNGVEYSKKFFSKTTFEDIENYLFLFTKNWPSIYEIYDSKDNLNIHIVGYTSIYDNIKSLYHIVINNNVEANHFYKLLKALFILQTEVPDYFEFNTDIDKNGNLEFYFNDKKIVYSEMAKFIKEQYNLGITLKKKKRQKIKQSLKKLEDLKQIAAMQDIEYLEKEKQISTFLECKKTFFGKFKYYFKYSKKNKKNKMREKQAGEIKEVNTNKNRSEKNNIIEEVEDIPISKKYYTIEELIDSYKELEKEEISLRDVIMDINAIKLKNKNMAKKIENATMFIQEIDNHKRSIFEFWRYSNKDEISVLPEGEEEEIGIVKRIEKTFDYLEDFEAFGKELDILQREKLTRDEVDSIYIATTNIIEQLNQIKTGEIQPKDVESLLKDLKKELKESGEFVEREDFDIFSGIVENNKVKKIGNIKHREMARDKFHILEINRMTKQIGFKLTLEQIVKNIKKAYGKVKTPQDIILYKGIMDEKIDEDNFNVFNINPEKELEEISKIDGSEINLYKINLKKGDDLLGFTNIIFYENENKTLPLGMDFSTNAIVDISKIEWNIKKSRTFNILCFDNEEDDFSDFSVKNVVVYE